MIARIVTGSGRNRRTFDLPCSNDRKKHVSERIAFGNIIKSKVLWPGGRGYRAAQARGEQRAAAYAASQAVSA